MVVWSVAWDLGLPQSSGPRMGERCAAHTVGGGFCAAQTPHVPLGVTPWVPLQTVQDGRQFLKYVDPRLGVPLPERDYGGNCLIYDADNETDPFHNVWVRTGPRTAAQKGVAGQRYLSEAAKDWGGCYRAVGALDPEALHTAWWRRVPAGPCSPWLSGCVVHTWSNSVCTRP